MRKEEIKGMVREHYARIAKQGSSRCSSGSSCCGSNGTAKDIGERIGYIDEEVASVPEGANLCLGCGNPLAFISLREGEVVLDLGAGAGLDCFLAAERVGESGKVIGVDMTPEMINRARENAKQGNYGNVEFRLGEIENLPVADNSVDVIISNCVINLVPDKIKGFKETYRVLKPGGKLMISDVVLLKELPDFIKNSIEAYVGCLSGAIVRDEYIEAIKTAGYQGVRVIDESPFPVESILSEPVAKTVVESLGISSKEVKEIGSSVMSTRISGIKPS